MADAQPTSDLGLCNIHAWPVYLLIVLSKRLDVGLTHLLFMLDELLLAEFLNFHLFAVDYGDQLSFQDGDLPLEHDVVGIAFVPLDDDVLLSFDIEHLDCFCQLDVRGLVLVK